MVTAYRSTPVVNQASGQVPETRGRSCNLERVAPHRVDRVLVPTREFDGVAKDDRCTVRYDDDREVRRLVLARAAPLLQLIAQQRQDAIARLRAVQDQQ